MCKIHLKFNQMNGRFRFFIQTHDVFNLLALVLPHAWNLIDNRLLLAYYGWTIYVSVIWIRRTEATYRQQYSQPFELL